MRVVFDTNTVVSALLFNHGRLSWLRYHWRREDIVALASKATTDELIRVFAYPKFQLSRAAIESLLAEYLPHVHAISVSSRRKSPKCRDPYDQMFVDLAIQGQADVLVSGDRDLLSMDFMPIENPADYARRFDS